MTPNESFFSLNYRSPLTWIEKRAEASDRRARFNRYSKSWQKALEIARRKPARALYPTPFDFLAQCAMLPDLIGSDRPLGIALCIHAAERAGVGFPIHEAETIANAFDNAIGKLAQIMLINSHPLSDRERAELAYELERREH